MNYSGIINCSIVDGDGFRVALYVSGCRHHCEGCHNKETWDFKAGKPFTKEVEDILFDRLNKPYIKGLTLTGGDPLYNADEIFDVITKFKNTFGNDKDIWLYTGYTMSDILNNEKLTKIVNLVDYIVDGKFEIAKRDISLPFRGSSNQVIWQKNEEGQFIRSILN